MQSASQRLALPVLGQDGEVVQSEKGKDVEKCLKTAHLWISVMALIPALA